MGCATLPEERATDMGSATGAAALAPAPAQHGARQGHKNQDLAVRGPGNAQRLSDTPSPS